MITRAFIAAILAGVVAGLVMSAVQHFRTTPLIIKAETYERVSGHNHSDKAATSEHSHKHTNTAGGTENIEPWAPADGFERTAYNIITDIVIAIGFAFVLLAISLLTNISITPANGALWGLLAFAVVTLSPAAGLPPELPAMPTADLTARQVWWWGTVISGTIGVALIALRGGMLFTPIAVGLFAAPHIIGAPQPTGHETAIPAHLIQQYVANSLFLMAITWIVVGVALGVSAKSQNLVEAR